MEAIFYLFALTSPATDKWLLEALRLQLYIHIHREGILGGEITNRQLEHRACATPLLK